MRTLKSTSYFCITMNKKILNMYWLWPIIKFKQHSCDNTESFLIKYRNDSNIASNHRNSTYDYSFLVFDFLPLFHCFHAQKFVKKRWKNLIFPLFHTFHRFITVDASTRVKIFSRRATEVMINNETGFLAAKESCLSASKLIMSLRGIWFGSC